MDEQEQPPRIFRKSNGGYRQQSLANLLRMGHCAPTVMRTLANLTEPDHEWLIRLCAGMPGGIGNTGSECGAVTSSLAMFGLRYGLRESDRGLPVIFDRGHALSRRFLECHKTLLCKDIRGNDRFPIHCIRPVLLSPELYLEALSDRGSRPISADLREGHGRLYSYMAENSFHCARAVFEQFPDRASEHPKLFDVISAFIGGTCFMGLTCSAFTAGVMEIGLRCGEIENSPLRVLRMIMIMTIGGNAFDEKINKFNRSMNKGYQLSKWFRREFGSTQCRMITQCDFSSPGNAKRYTENGGITRCREISEKVAERVQQMLADQGQERPASP